MKHIIKFIFNMTAHIFTIVNIIYQLLYIYEGTFPADVYMKIFHAYTSEYVLYSAIVSICCIIIIPLSTLRIIPLSTLRKKGIYIIDSISIILNIEYLVFYMYMLSRS